MDNYKGQVRSALWLAGILAAVSVMTMLSLLACYAIESLSLSKKGYLLGGAVAAIFALVSQDRYNRFKALLVPNTFSTEEFNKVLMKYCKYQSIGSWVFLVVAILGVAVGVLGSIKQ
ncbi:hypothetical protein [Xanthomonas bromi]|uniref:Integron gene cassette protein n=1 Tax=Xanthomonas bromi TaxID=56449 RepID=A0ABX5BK66_9XANT|nr:hypothetical protein [Xanthomonas bromi]PPV04965.1 hypothetical protein XbrCFBP1976_19545 [Xanthomonas bromi]